MRFRPDPGACPICGAAHCSCDGGPIVVEQLPATAALRASSTQSAEPPVELLQPLAVAEPEPAPFTTSSYRGTQKPRGSSSRA
jgi:hypothetical protein